MRDWFGKFIAIILTFAFIVILAFALIAPSHPTAVQAQETPLFSTPFSAGVNVTIIPACTTQVSTPTNPCIANQSQTAGSVTLQWKFGTNTGDSYAFIEGSNNNSNWFILAQNVQPPCASTCTAGAMMFYNGAYTYIRIYIFNAVNGSTSGVYTAYPQPLPINPMVDQNNETLPSTPFSASNLDTSNPLILQGFQCYNIGGSTAYLQLFKSPTGAVPTLGTAFFFEVGIPAGTEFVYNSGPIAVASMIPNAGTTGTLWAGAATVSGGATHITAGNLQCNFQANTSGPFYPFTTVGP